MQPYIHVYSCMHAPVLSSLPVHLSIPFSAKSCFSTKAHSDKKTILPADQNLKQLSDPREDVGVTVVENPLAEETTDPSY